MEDDGTKLGTCVTVHFYFLPYKQPVGLISKKSTNIFLNTNGNNSNLQTFILFRPTATEINFRILLYIGK